MNPYAIKADIRTDNMRLLSLAMSNFDHTIDTGLAEELMAEPGKVCAQYTGYDFFSKVWFENDQFHAVILRYTIPVEIISEDSLEEIMVSVCAEYGM